MPPEPSSLAARLKAQIAAHGPLSLADYMQACLSDARAGYYAAHQPIGGAGDFITAPEISQVFGELIALWVVAVWQSWGEGEVCIAELGPGRGTLISDASRIWRRFPGLCRKLSLALVETSPALKDAQAKALAAPGLLPPTVDLSWHDDVAALPDRPLIVLANEFLDALPIRQFRRQSDQAASEPDGRKSGARAGHWRERMVSLNEAGAFAFIEQPLDGAPPKELAPFEALAEEGEIVEIRSALTALVEALASRAAAHPLAALFIDYGAERSGPGDTLQSVFRHHFASPLAHPGEADLTAHVDFEAMRNQAENRSLSAYGPMPQGEFLLKLGLAERQAQLLKAATAEQTAMLVSGINRLIDPQQMGLLFKAFVLTGRDAPAPPPFETP